MKTYVWMTVSAIALIIVTTIIYTPRTPVAAPQTIADADLQPVDSTAQPYTLPPTPQDVPDSKPMSTSTGNATQEDVVAQENLMAEDQTCSDWGKTIIKTDHFLDNPYADTHYSTTLGECIVEVHSSTDYPNTGGDYENEDDVFSAENNKLLFAMSSYMTDGNFSQVGSDYRNNYDNLDNAQFEALEQQYMND